MLHRNKYFSPYLASFVISVSFLLSSCAEEEDSTTSGNNITPQAVNCSTHQDQFNNDIWPILSNDCTTCHTLNGVSSDLVLLPESINNYAQANFNTFQKVAAKTDSSGLSLLVVKPINANNDHGGGQRFDVDSVERIAIEGMVEKLSTCSSDTLKIVDLNVGTGYQRLRKSTLALAGRLPTPDEEQQIESANGDAATQEVAFDTLLDTFLTSSYFYERIKIIFNDMYLLDAFPGTRALGQFDLRNYTNKDYFKVGTTALPSPFTLAYPNKTERDTLRRYANRGLSQAPLELIAHVVREDRSFKEILTATYTMVNPYSATLYDALKDTEPRFQFQLRDGVGLNDPADFREAKITYTDKDSNIIEIPHAGILTMPSFLRRYPSTRTNRNRARSRVAYSIFLDINVLGLASSGDLDLDAVTLKPPTLKDPQCTACHNTVDPLAGLFKNWNNRGSYQGDFGDWPYKGTDPKILPPGFTMEVVDQLPDAEGAKALQWLAKRIVNDAGFASRVVEIMFRGLTGQDLPVDFNFVEKLKADFVAGNFKLKSLTKDIVRSPYFLAVNLNAQADPESFPDVGMGRLLTPEMLDRKISAVTSGYRWRSPSQRNLLNVATYKLLYGGIDSDTVVLRTTTPTSLMAGAQQQIANQTACVEVPKDFNKPIDQRVLFPIVEMTDVPDDVNGMQRIKENIVYLHKRILGEELDITSAEITRSYDLYVAVRDLTTGEGLPACRDRPALSNSVATDANQTVRPWTAILTYLLSDYKFFYE